MWIIADIESGKIIEEHQTGYRDFSDASYDIKYNIIPNKKYNASVRYENETLAILDSVREEYLATGVINDVEYRRYFDRIIQNIPEYYQRFLL